MLSPFEIGETLTMIQKEHLDVRTITMGISLLDCIDSDSARCCEKIYNKITSRAKNLVSVGHAIETELGVPIINKRISVTPISLIASASGNPVAIAKTLDRAGKSVGVNFIGGYSALVQKGCSAFDEQFISSIPEALSETDIVCSSVAVASTKAGINMDAVRRMGEIIKETAVKTADHDGFG